jgi:hypothetical protein
MPGCPFEDGFGYWTHIPDSQGTRFRIFLLWGCYRGGKLHPIGFDLRRQWLFGLMIGEEKARKHFLWHNSPIGSGSLLWLHELVLPPDNHAGGNRYEQG